MQMLVLRKEFMSIRIEIKHRRVIRTGLKIELRITMIIIMMIIRIRTIHIRI
jgi:hypothetical protein